MQKRKESETERRLREGVEMLGGECLKFISPSMSGVPDRVILLPPGRVWFVEVKRKGEVPSVRQRRVLQWMRENGFQACCVYGDSDVDVLLRNLKGEGGDAV